MCFCTGTDGIFFFTLILINRNKYDSRVIIPKLIALLFSLCFRYVPIVEVYSLKLHTVTITCFVVCICLELSNHPSVSFYIVLFLSIIVDGALYLFQFLNMLRTFLSFGNVKKLVIFLSPRFLKWGIWNFTGMLTFDNGKYLNILIVWIWGM